MIRPTLLALALFSVINSACAAPDTPLPHSPGAPYAASGLADRIVLTPGADPAREMAVTFRTDTRQQTSQLQLAPALDGPQLAKAAHEVGKNVTILQTGGGSNDGGGNLLTNLLGGLPGLAKELDVQSEVLNGTTFNDTVAGLINAIKGNTPAIAETAQDLSLPTSESDDSK